MELKLGNSSSLLARLIEIKTFELFEDGGYFNPEVRTLGSSKGATYAWSGNGMCGEGMFVRGKVGILDNASGEYFRLERTIDNEIKEIKITKGTYEAMRTLI